MILSCRQYVALYEFHYVLFSMKSRDRRPSRERERKRSRSRDRHTKRHRSKSPDRRDRDPKASRKSEFVVAFILHYSIVCNYC